MILEYMYLQMDIIAKKTVACFKQGTNADQFLSRHTITIITSIPATFRIPVIKAIEMQ